MEGWGAYASEYFKVKWHEPLGPHRPCPTCKGQPCAVCGGSGTYQEVHDPWAKETLGCPECRGEPCPDCGSLNLPAGETELQGQGPNQEEMT